MQALVAGDGYGINQLGDVVGAIYPSAGITHAFIWTDRRGVKDLGTLPGSAYSVAYGVNDNDEVVGVSAASTGEIHAVVWRPKKNLKKFRLVDLGTFGGVSAEANAINASGVVVGCWTEASGRQHAFSWSAASGVRDLGSLSGGSACATSVNDNGIAAGFATVLQAGPSGMSPYIHAVIFRNGAVQDLGTFGGLQSWAYAINASEMVAGRHQSFNSYRAFFWSNGSFRDVGPMGLGNSEAFGVNSAGDVVGDGPVATRGPNMAFFWSHVTGTSRTLPSLGGNTSIARSINDHGQAAGTASDATGTNYAVRWNGVLASE